MKLLWVHIWVFIFAQITTIPQSLTKVDSNIILNMKKILVSILTFAAVAVSCSDFIEKEARGTQTLENYFQTAQECENYTNELTQRLLLAKDWYTLLAPRLINETATDDAWMGNTGQDNGAFRPCAQYVVTPENMGAMNSIYTAHYYTIQSANIGFVLCVFQRNNCCLLSGLRISRW